jgi:predicted small lipoprotein YifL
MRPSTTTILATAAAVASMVLLAGCGGDGPEGAPPPPATTKAAPARNAAADTPRLFVVDANGNDARRAFFGQMHGCKRVGALPHGRVDLNVTFSCVADLLGGYPPYRWEDPYPPFKVETTAR